MLRFLLDLLFSKIITLFIIFHLIILLGGKNVYAIECLDEPKILNYGNSLEREIKKGEIHSYFFTAKENYYVKIIVVQKGSDVVLSLFSSESEKLRDVDSPNGDIGLEVLSLTTKEASSYVLKVESSNTTSPIAKYEIKIQEYRNLTKLDKELVEIEILKNQVIQLFYGSANYDSAIPILKNIIEREKKLFGNIYDEQAFSINLLGEIQYNKGNYDEAEVLFNQALDVCQNSFHKDPRVFSEVLNNLGLLNQDYKGDYVKSENFYNEALKIKEALVGGANHPIVAIQINNLALLNKEQGNYDKAETLYKQVLRIYKSTLGIDSLQYYTSLNNLAVLYTAKRDYDKAQELCKEVLEIGEKLFGNNSIYKVMALSNLSNIYYRTTQYNKAEKIFHEIAPVFKKAFGIDHPNLATLYNNIAALYQETGEYDKAEHFYKESLKIREKRLGLTNPYLAQIYNSLSILYLLKKDVNTAITYKNKSEEIREKDLARNLLLGSESEKLKYLNLTSKEKDFAVFLHLKMAPESIEACKVAVNSILRRKGRLLDATTNSINLLRNENGFQEKILLEKLSDLHKKITTLIARGIKDEGSEKYFKTIQYLESELEKTEKEISSKSQQFSILTSEISLEAIQKLIPADSALIEFSTYETFDPINRDFSGQLNYAAYIIDSTSTPLFVDLGNVNDVDDVIIEFRDALVKKYDNKLSDIEKKVKPIARSADKIILEKIRTLLRNKKHLLIAPDGLLNLVPFEAFMDGKGKYLIEDYEVSYLTSGRDLIRLKNKTKSKTPSVIIADPTYGDGPGPVIAGTAYPPLKSLVGSYEEAIKIKDILEKSNVFTKKNASKEIFENLNSPHILHVATHGFFLPDVSIKNDNRTFDGKYIDDLTTRNIIVENYKELKLANPFLRAYLFFAGANENSQNGVLSGLEVSSLNLLGTNLVVLSACETGLGEVRNGQGVYGLRRALLLAGSQTQIISLWSISDKFTVNLMVNYYKLLKSGRTRSQALREVQLACLSKMSKEENSLQLLQLKDFAHPYYWASFIQSGEWGNLEIFVMPAD